MQIEQRLKHESRLLIRYFDQVDVADDVSNQGLSAYEAYPSWCWGTVLNLRHNETITLLDNCNRLARNAKLEFDSISVGLNLRCARVYERFITYFSFPSRTEVCGKRGKLTLVSTRIHMKYSMQRTNTRTHACAHTHTCTHSRLHIHTHIHTQTHRHTNPFICLHA
jgi:hypothetical protein